MARQPVPCKVTFLGDLVSLADEKDWHENTGRGDTQVVQGVLTMMDDPEADVRRVVVEALPCVCPAGDADVLAGISLSQAHVSSPRVLPLTPNLCTRLLSCR